MWMLCYENGTRLYFVGLHLQETTVSANEFINLYCIVSVPYQLYYCRLL